MAQRFMVSFSWEKRIETLEQKTMKCWKPYVQTRSYRRTQERYELFLQDSIDDVFFLPRLIISAYQWTLDSRAGNDLTDLCEAGVSTFPVHQISESLWCLCNKSNVTKISFGITEIRLLVWKLYSGFEPPGPEVAMKLHGWTSKPMCRRWRTRHDDCRDVLRPCHGDGSNDQRYS
jgi:hypothetical protein